jgi:hypothetical protein
MKGTMSDALLPTLLRTPAVWARRLAYATAAGVFLGVIGAFGTFTSAPLPARVASWVIMLWAGTLIFPPLSTVAIVLGRRWAVPIWISLPLAVLAGSLPMAAFARLATRTFIHPGARMDWLETCFQTMIIALPMVAAYVAVQALIDRTQAPAAPSPAADTTPAPDPPLLARLPARLGRDLLCLQMEDHYVRAHTALGSDLMLMRMRDAVDLLEGLDGLQVHRSWWVAAKAVERHAAGDRKVTLVLRNGLEVPVARSAVAAVKAAGWLE